MLNRYPFHPHNDRYLTRRLNSFDFIGQRKKTHLAKEKLVWYGENRIYNRIWSSWFSMQVQTKMLITLIILLQPELAESTEYESKMWRRTRIQHF